MIVCEVYQGLLGNHKESSSAQSKGDGKGSFGHGKRLRSRVRTSCAEYAKMVTNAMCERCNECEVYVSVKCRRNDCPSEVELVVAVSVGGLWCR